MRTMTARATVLGIPIDRVSLREAAEKVESWIAARPGRPRVIVTPNAEIVYAAQTDRELWGILQKADLMVPDGIGVVWASKRLGEPVPEKVSGVDLASELMARFSRTGRGIYLFGGKPGVAEAAASRLRETFPGLRIVGHHHGYFKPEEEAGLVEEINRAAPDLLFVCLGSPKQEKWIWRNQDRLDVPAAIGLGGSLDIWAGIVQLSPEFIRRAGLEWLHRLIREPRRFKRQLALPRFALAVLRHGRNPVRRPDER